MNKLKFITVIDDESPVNFTLLWLALKIDMTPDLIHSLVYVATGPDSFRRRPWE